jgi:P27 family predicted phage terminase small subunit
MPGPPPKPTPLLKLSGSWRAQKRKGEPTAPTGTPKPPKWLTPETLEAWQELVAAIEPMRVLTQSDALALAQAAEYLAKWKRMTAKVAQMGEVIAIRDAAGNVTGFRQSPFAALQMQYGGMLHRFMSEFGLSPSARARLTGATETQENTSFFTKQPSRR